MVALGISHLMDAAGTNKAQRNIRDPIGIVRQWLGYRLIAAPQECVASATRPPTDVFMAHFVESEAS